MAKVLLLLLLLSLLGSNAGCDEQPASASMEGPKSWYTIDDGKSWFADSANKVVPFEHQGKQAYRCFVWSCDGGKTQFVSHLERLSAAGRRAFAGKDHVDPMELVPGSEEVKLPLTGNDGWMISTSAQAQSVRMPKCPERGGGTPEAVWPK
jgi:hypothetical protein